MPSSAFVSISQEQVSAAESRAARPDKKTPSAGAEGGKAIRF